MAMKNTSRQRRRRLTVKTKTPINGSGIHQPHRWKYQSAATKADGLKYKMSLGDLGEFNHCLHGDWICVRVVVSSWRNWARLKMNINREDIYVYRGVNAVIFLLTLRGLCKLVLDGVLLLACICIQYTHEPKQIWARLQSAACGCLYGSMQQWLNMYIPLVVGRAALYWSRSRVGEDFWEDRVTVRPHHEASTKLYRPDAWGRQPISNILA